MTLSDNDAAMSHSADVRMMTKILTDSSVRQANVLAVAQWMASQPLATGLTIDYENGLPQNLTDLVHRGTGGRLVWTVVGRGG